MNISFFFMIVNLKLLGFAQNETFEGELFELFSKLLCPKL